MFLKKLEVGGFKSFAHRTVLEFEPGITSIVGPNGSGKSNLADALRWVFGEQSMKLLRGKKSEDVIFAGSDQKSRLGGASVFVYFDNRDHNIAIDYDEVVIGRRLYRDGNSEYLLNGSKVRLIDIQELLTRSGLGQTSYYVIGQGMIDQLVLGGPAAIKELLEEASGVKPYYVKRERALRKLLRTETNLEQAGALIKEIEPRLRSLRRQTKRFEQRDQVELELREAQALYFAGLFWAQEKELGEIEGKDRVFVKELAELEEEIGVLKKEIEQEEDSTYGDNTRFQQQENELVELRRIKQGFLEERAVLRGEMRVFQAQAEPPKLDWPAFRRRLNKLEESLNAFFVSFRQRPEQAETQIELLQNEVREIIAQLAVSSGDRVQNKFEQEQKMRKLDEEISRTAERIEQLEKIFTDQSEESLARKQALFVKERALRAKQDNLIKTREQRNQVAVEIARLQTRKESVEQEMKMVLGDGYLEIIDKHRGQLIPRGLDEKIVQLKNLLEGIGRVDDLTLREHQETEARFRHLSEQSTDLEKGILDLRSAIEELDEVIKRDFDEAFQKISEKFSEYFRILFGGGKATMTVIRERPRPEEKNLEDELEEELMDKKLGNEVVGIVIKATPPGKKLSGIAALSGGERALTSIALLSAILATSPSPFVVLDEVDAALDEANSIRFGKILGELSQKSQFITITHNRETMRRSHILYGVTMGDDGVSRVLSLKLEQAAVYSSRD